MPFSLAYRSLWSQVRKGFVGGAALTLMASCSLVVETDVDQCSTDDDCTKKGTAFAGTHCSARRICVSEGSGEGCQSSADCPEADGEKKVCNGAGACVSLLSDECTDVKGDYRSPNAVLVGAILPLPAQGGDRSTGLACFNGIEQANRLIAQAGQIAVQGLNANRSLAVIYCNDNSDSTTAKKAAQHLTASVRVPAIIGPVFSGITVDVSAVTIPPGTLLISPSATSATITGLKDNNLVWRTSPSDILQGSALAKLMDYLEPRVRLLDELDKGGSPTPTRVAILNKGDSYGSGLATRLESTLSFNKKAATDNEGNYIAFDYGDPNNPTQAPTKYPDAVAKVLATTPHIIYLLGSAESVTSIFKPIEQQWPAGVKRPFYVFADAGNLPDTVAAINELNTENLHARVLGTVPGSNSALFKSFVSLYNKNVNDGSSPETFGAAGSFDSTFLLALSVAAQGTGAITGATLATGLTRLVPPVSSPDAIANAGDVNQLQSAFGKLSSDPNIHVDYNGASGALDFDVTTGEASSDIQFWCIPTSAASSRTPGAYYSTAPGDTQNTLQGTDVLESFCK